MEQLGFEGMPRRLYVCTPTRLGTWLDCPRRYRMSYLDQPAPPKGPPWAHNSLGASVHNALASWWRLPRPERTVTAAGDLLDGGWLTDGFAGQAQSDTHRQRCRQLVEGYVARLDPAAEPAGVERTVATRSDLIAVSGRIDRLDDRRSSPLGASGDPAAGELVVVDYKTGRYRPTVDDVRTSLPLALYALGAERVLRRPCLRVELHHLPSGTVLGWEHTPETLARQLSRAEDIAAECAAADARYQAVTAAAGGSSPRDVAAGGSGGSSPRDVAAGGSGGSSPRDVAAGSDSAAGAAIDEALPPRPGPGCGWCDFRALCPEGSAASVRRRPWDGLEADDEPEPTGIPAGAGATTDFPD